MAEPRDFELAQLHLPAARDLEMVIRNQELILERLNQLISFGQLGGFGSQHGLLLDETDNPILDDKGNPIYY